MAEEQKVPVPEEKKQDAAQPQSELVAELERIRFRNKILKITASVLAALFVALAAAAFLAYRKISQTKAAIDSALQNYQPPAQGYRPEGLPMPGGGPSVFQSTEAASSGLGLFSGSIPGQQPEPLNPAEGVKIADAMTKYADRPIVKEFIADLKKDPELARALAQSKGTNPMAMLASLKGSKGLNAIIAKYSTRPDFLKLMMEVMRDPDMKPVMSRMPPGAGLPGQGIPQTVPVAVEPGEEPAQEEETGSMTLDSSVISGPAKTAPAASHKVPPPVDTQ